MTARPIPRSSGTGRKSSGTSSTPSAGQPTQQWASPGSMVQKSASPSARTEPNGSTEVHWRVLILSAATIPSGLPKFSGRRERITCMYPTSPASRPTGSTRAGCCTMSRRTCGTGNFSAMLTFTPPASSTRACMKRSPVFLKCGTRTKTAKAAPMPPSAVICTAGRFLARRFPTVRRKGRTSFLSAEKSG